jgi:hypothetical protein
MLKVNDFLKYTITLDIEYENYFSLIYDTKYLLEARLGPDRQFVAKKSIYANCRKRAVQKAVQWFWKEFKGALGSVHKTMTVDDPHGEVVYNEGFACNDLGHKYLSEETVDRVIEESDGELFRDLTEGSENHPPNSVKRAKRRRKQSNVIAPRMTQSPAGTIYYRTTMVPQYSKDGKIIQRRKVKNVKLASKTLNKALREVSRRGLDRHEKVDVIPSDILEENLKEAA